MAAGLVLRRLIPGLSNALAAVEVGSICLPITVGVSVMMHPVLAKVRYDRLERTAHDGVGGRRNASAAH